MPSNPDTDATLAATGPAAGRAFLDGREVPFMEAVVAELAAGS
ncbi:MAG: hypothetical protein WKF96_10120 [Solirubrobacteraceae bacterium]